MFTFKNRLLKSFSVLNLKRTNSKIKNNEIMLGRWHINYDEDKVKTIVRLANEDHCGVCNDDIINEKNFKKLEEKFSYERMCILDDINVNRELTHQMVCCGNNCSNCKYITTLNKEKIKL